MKLLKYLPLALLVLILSACAGVGSGTGSISGSLTTDNSQINITSTGSASLAEIPLLQSQNNRPAYVPGQILVQYREDNGSINAQAKTAARLELSQSLQAEYKLQALKIGSVRRPDLLKLGSGQNLEAVIARLQNDPRVLYAEPNYYLYTTALPNDPDIGQQWALASAGLPVAWDIETGSSNPVTVAVLDTGFDLTHEDLQGRFIAGYDFCGNTDCTVTDNDPGYGNASNFHGTHVAGIIGAMGNNAAGIAGVAYGSNTKLLPVKIFNDTGNGATTDAFIDGIDYAIGNSVTTADSKTIQNSNPARVINLSLGGYFNSSIVQTVIDDARASGAIVIAATGNDGLGEIMSPAAANGVIGVGSINKSFNLSCFSNYGSSPNGPGVIDIVAPGGAGPGTRCSETSESVLSTIPVNTYGGTAGTSMAAPMVSGVAALILSQNPGLSVGQLEAKLLDTAYFDSSYMTANEYGAGVLRADRALGLAGPGDSITVYAAASNPANDAVGSAELDLFGGSSTYIISNLEADSYELRAGDNTSGSLYGSINVSLASGETKNGQAIALNVVP